MVRLVFRFSMKSNGFDILERLTTITSGFILGTWTFQNLIIKGPLIVQGKFSGMNLKDVFDRALRLDEPSIPEMIFKSNVFVSFHFWNV